MATEIRDKLTPLGKRVQKQRDAGAQWPAIAEKESQTAGKCMLAYLCVTEPLVKYKNETDLAAKIVNMRKRDQLSWGVISARVDVSESTVRTIYTNATGDSTRGDRIGKGGRWPGQENGEARKGGGAKKAPATKKAKASTVAKAAREKAAARKAGGTKKATGVKKVAKKAAPAKAGTSAGRSAGKKSPLLDMTLGELKDRLEDETITVVRDGGREQKITVKTVKSKDNGVLEFVDRKSGATRNVRIEDIKNATKSASAEEAA